MRTISPLLAFLGGALVVGAAWLGSGPDSGPGEASYCDDPLGATALHGDDGTQARLARMERQLEALLAAVERRGGPVSTGPDLAVRGEGAVPAGAAAQPVITDEVLDKTLERMAERRYAKMTPEQLRSEARRQMRQEKNMNAARDVLQRLLKRDLEPDLRGQALTDLGSVHRELGEFEASEKALRGAMRTAGLDTETGIKAGYHLVWTFSRAKETGRALAMADELIANRNAPESFRPWLRWAGARMAYDHGDKERALRDYRALMADVKDKQQFRQILRDATARLKELDEGPR